MTVKEFIEQYNEVKDKETYIKSLYKKEYVPFETKVSDCERIVKATSYTNTEPNMFKQNTSSRNMLFILTLVDRYTDIDVDFGNALEEYNLLCTADMDMRFNKYYEHCMAGEFLHKELERYDEILYDVARDFEANNRSMVAYLDTKLASLEILGETFEKIMSENTSV